MGKKVPFTQKVVFVFLMIAGNPYALTLCIAGLFVAGFGIIIPSAIAKFVGGFLIGSGVWLGLWGDS